MPFKSKYNLSPGNFANCKIPNDLVHILMKIAEKRERATWAEILRDCANSYVAMHRARGNVE